MFRDKYLTELPMESLVKPAMGSMAADVVAMAPAGEAPRVVSAGARPATQRDLWYARARAVMPWGVSSNFRYWSDADTPVIARGKGAYIWDVDGKRYIDYRLGFGPVILGHAYEAVTQAVFEAMQDGNTFAFTNVYEVRAAERICRMTGVDKVRFTNSGSESTMHALRIARAHTNRERFIKFEGCYHGAHDYVMWSTSDSPVSAMGSRRSPIPVSTSSGIPSDVRKWVITLPFNDFAMLERTVRDHGHSIAAILVEPMMGNMASIMPAKGWLEFIRKLCDDYGIVMILDEVKTGFRIAPGGAQQFFGVRADLVTYAKAMGNGFPIGAIGGKEEFMMTIEPGAVGHGGTYCGNVVSVAACDAVLRVMEEEPVFETIHARGLRLMAGIQEILNRFGIPHSLTGVPAMFGLIIGNDESTDKPSDHRSAERFANDALMDAIFEGLYARGIMPDPDYGEPWFLCYALSEADVDETLQAYEDAVKAALR
ncbi:MAG: aspartate aminotransferase family protein [Chloroflexi bacterium]|jgi:glutamate-1-semialdehyde 2,1-aminomutase|uniref:Aspartate aminotransferase family protein n=2 Tax=Candidatus Thermofonsia Clade 3 TaxID=2364209 RepID=A0A2M8QDV1_9CHLR|nr:MAG: aspartate aminotransferase family protein [Candidatus Thermofonsia Clade 3 bacterium]RMG65292.1 MAG: aspartate aminotransferase family protein [Chloroflexota bacterium]